MGTILARTGTKLNHENMLHRIFHEDATTENDEVSKMIGETMQNSDYQDEPERVKTFITTTEQLIADMKRAMLETTSVNLLFFMIITLPEAILEFRSHFGSSWHMHFE